MGAIRLSGVAKSFGRTRVIHGIDLDVAAGELVVIVGPSGCGKSTLLRMVAGLESVSEGTIRIGERVVNDLEPRERDIAMVFQNYALYPHMSVYRNMAYGLSLKGMPGAEIRERVERAASLLALSDYLDRRPRALSGGQRQRVAMGRAIVREPAAFLFDEPLSNLDAKLRVQMRLEIRTLQRRLATTALYVTHDQVEAMTMADRMVVMNAGRVEQTGRPMDVYARPASLFVAGFIGSPPMNALRDPAGGGTLGVRPEDVEIRAEGGGRLAGEVVMVEPLGAETLVHVRAGDATALVARRPAGETVAEGARVGLDWAAGAEHRFDASGRRCE
ncbi:MAG: ABC transporter ATP-binding protein [Paracoccaceae bacterium]